MAGSMSRNKGARGEREVIALLQPIVDRVCLSVGMPQIVLQRNQDQRFAAKQYDLIGLPWVALEIKRQESDAGLPSWWRQVRTATRDGQVSVLIWRANYQDWRVRMRVPIIAGETRIMATVDVDWLTFTIWFEQALISWTRR